MSVSLSSIFKLLIIGILVAIISGCQEVRERNLAIAAASDLVTALPELGKDFEAKSGVKVVPSFGASGILKQQIQNGAPFAVFLSADRQYIEQLVQAGKVSASARRIYARGRLVLWSKTIHVASLDDLLKPEVKQIAIANPGYAPYGRAARAALEHVALWDKVSAKIVVAESIRHTMEMAESGNADVAITALSLVRAGSGFMSPVPEQLYSPIEQEAAVIGEGTSDARAFLDYLGSPEARAILKKFGFGLPGS